MSFPDIRTKSDLVAAVKSATREGVKDIHRLMQDEVIGHKHKVALNMRIENLVELSRNKRPARPDLTLHARIYLQVLARMALTSEAFDVALEARIAWTFSETSEQHPGVQNTLDTVMTLLDLFKEIDVEVAKQEASTAVKN